MDALYAQLHPPRPRRAPERLRARAAADRARSGRGAGGRPHVRRAAARRRRPDAADRLRQPRQPAARAGPPRGGARSACGWRSAQRRGRVVQQMLVESLAARGVGGLAGLAVAAGCAAGVLAAISSPAVCQSRTSTSRSIGTALARDLRPVARHRTAVRRGAGVACLAHRRSRCHCGSIHGRRRHAAAPAASCSARRSRSASCCSPAPDSSPAAWLPLSIVPLASTSHNVMTATVNLVTGRAIDRTAPLAFYADGTRTRAGAAAGRVTRRGAASFPTRGLRMSDATVDGYTMAPGEDAERLHDAM